MIFYSGWGLIVPLLHFVIGILIAIISEKMPHGILQYFVGFVLCGVATVAYYKIGVWFNNKPYKTTINEVTGIESQSRTIHSFMFIRFEYWAAPFAFGAIICLFLIFQYLYFSLMGV